MAGRNKNEAIDSFCGFFKESLSCLTDAYLHPIQQSPNRYLLTYEPPAILLCEAGSRSISITQVFSAGPDKQNGGFKVKTHQYSYSLNNEEGRDIGEIVSYHWHPEGTEVDFPHLHIECAPRVHFPTARVSIESFIWMLIDYYEIRPILSDLQWKRILKRNHAAFNKMATWK